MSVGDKAVRHCLPVSIIGMEFNCRPQFFDLGHLAAVELRPLCPLPQSLNFSFARRFGPYPRVQGSLNGHATLEECFAQIDNLWNALSRLPF
jgi:hypothetical protein